MYFNKIKAKDSTMTETEEGDNPESTFSKLLSIPDDIPIR